MSRFFDIFPIFGAGLFVCLVTFHWTSSNTLADSEQKTLVQPNIFSVPKTQAKNPDSETFLHTIKIIVTRLEDIKVKEKQVVKPGDIISDRSSERYPLLAKKRQLEIALSQSSLPLTDTTEIAKSQFKQQRMALQKAKFELKRVTEQIDNYQEFAFKDPQLSEILEPEKVEKLAALKEKQIVHSLTVKEELVRLNEARIQHSIQLETYQTNLYKQKYELESLNNQLQEVNAQLKEIIAVRSPYAGYVYRIKITGQSDRNLTAEIVLEVTRQETEDRSQETPSQEFRR